MVDNQHRQIKGYRDLTEEEIQMMNDFKGAEAQMGVALEDLDKHLTQVGDSEAKRWVAIARTYLEIGYMFAIKAVARPTNGLGRK